MPITKEQIISNLDQVKQYINEIENPKEKVYAKPDWGYFADLTDEFLDQTMTIKGVKYHRHANGGGWVSEKADVEDTVWVGVFAVVHNGVIKDQAIIHDRAVIDCSGLQEGSNSNVSGSAWVFGSAQVFGSALVYGLARVSGSAQVYGSARVSGLARVYGLARVSGLALVYGSARVYGNGYLKRSTFSDIELKNGETVE